jgi:hypothetical protein
MFFTQCCFFVYVLQAMMVCYFKPNVVVLFLTGEEKIKRPHNSKKSGKKSKEKFQWNATKTEVVQLQYLAPQ